MADFKIVTVEDLSTGLFSAELYYPESAAQPVTRTKSIFVSKSEAEAFAHRALIKQFPDLAKKITQKDSK